MSFLVDKLTSAQIT